MSKQARKQRRAQRRTTQGGTRVGVALRKTKEAVKKGAQAAAKGALTAPLIPFVPMMKSILRKRGVNPPSKVQELAQAFFKNVVKKTEGFESVEPVTITAIITAIISFFKKLKEKKAQGKGLTQEEKDVLNEVEKVGEAAAEINEGESSSSMGGLMPILLIGLAAIFLFKN